MVHEANPALKSVFDARLKLHDQIILFDKFRIVGIPVDPWTPYFRTNNFIQRAAAILLGFDETNEEFKKLVIDSTGALKVTASVAQNLYVDLNGVAQIVKGNTLGAVRVDPFGRELTVDNIFTNQAILAGASATHQGVNVAHAAAITVLAASDTTITIRPQISDNNADWYDLVDETDTLRTFAVNNSKRAFRIGSAAKFLRMFVTNTAATVATVTLKVLGQA